MIRRERRPINPEALQRIRDFLEVGLDDGDEAFLKRVEEEDTESSSSASEESSVASSDESASDQHSEADKEDKANEKQKNARKAKAEAKRKEQAALREKRKLEKEERKRRRAEEKGDSDSDRSVGSDDFGSNAGHDSSASEFTCSERDSELSSDDDDFSGKNGGKKKKSKKTGGAKKDKVSRAEREARRATREEERKEKKKLVGSGSGSGGGKEDNISHNKTAKTHQRNGTKKQQPSEAEIRAHNMMKRHAGAEAMAKLEGQVAKEFSQSARMKRASFREVESTNALRDMENRYTVGVKGGDEDGDEGGGISGLAGGVVVGKGSKGSGRKRGAASGSGTYAPSSNESSSLRNLTRLNSATTPAFNTHVLAPIALLEGVGVPSLLTQLEKLKTAQSLSVGGMGKISSPDLKRRRIDKEGVSDGVNSDPTRENNNNNNKTGSSFDSSSSAAAMASLRYDDPFTALKDRLIMLTYNVTPTAQPQQQQHQASAQSGTTSTLPSSSINCTDSVSGISTSFATPSNSATSASVACVKDILRRPSVRSFAHLEALERYEAWEESVETDKKLSSRRGRSAHPASGVKMLMMKVGGLSVDVLNTLGQKNYNSMSRTNEPLVTTTTSTSTDCSFHDYDEFYGEDDENYSSNKNRKGSDSDDDDFKDGGDEDYVHGGGAALCSRGGNVATYLSGFGGHSSSSSFGFSRLKFKSIFGEEGTLSVEALSTCIQQQLQGGGDVLSCLPALDPSFDHSASPPQNDGNSSNNKSNGLVSGTIATRRFTPALFVNPNSSENTYPLFQAHELASVL